MISDEETGDMWKEQETEEIDRIEIIIPEA